jgi:hypothetical protein
VADPQDSTSNGHAEALLEEPQLDVEDDLDDDIEELDGDDDAVALDDDLDLDHVSPAALGGEDDAVPAPANGAAPARVSDADLVARVQRLEQAAQALADAETSRDGRRVKRKVKAAAGGAGIAALIPFVLQIAGAFDLSPELVSGITAAVALVGAFAAGWTTPERKPSLPSSAVQSLLDGARM